MLKRVQRSFYYWTFFDILDEGPKGKRLDSRYEEREKTDNRIMG